MAVNQCTFIGNLGSDPEMRKTQAGDSVANFRIAVTERWKKDGERRESTEWVSIVVWGPLARIAEQYLRKGSKVFIQGKLKTRKWKDQQGNDRYSTEVVLQGYDAKMEMLDPPQGNLDDNQSGGYGGGSSGQQGGRPDFDDEDLPF